MWWQLTKLILAVLLLPAPALATIAAVGNLATGQSTTSTTTLVMTTSADLEAGNNAVCIVAKDNANTTDVNTTEISSIADSGGVNVWSELRSFTNGQTADNAGATVSIITTRATSTLASGGTITVTFTTAETSKAGMCVEYTAAAAFVIASGGSGVGFLDLAEDGTGAPGSMTLTLASGHRLYVRGYANENQGTAGWGDVTSTWTEFLSPEGDTAVTATSMQARGEYKIATSTTETSLPDQDNTNGRDRASIMLALIENIVVGGTQSMLTGVGK